MRLQWYLGWRKKSTRGPLRRILNLIGPTWLASPFRRLMQAAGLVAFAYLFCYVAWPYTARPARSWPGWEPVEIDAVTGNATVVARDMPSEPIVPGMVLFAVDPAIDEDRGLGAFEVVGIEGLELRLEPAGSLTEQQLDELSTSFGPWLLRESDPGAWPSHYADDILAKERIPAETFLALDPLVSISTSIGSRTPVRSAGFAGVILLVCLVIPRGFCGYVCPLGTLIDVFDWAVGRRVARLDPAAGQWWVRLKYYLLVLVLAGAVCGVVLTGFVAAIPIVTRGLAFLCTPIQTGTVRGWHQVPPITAGQYLSIGLFAGVFVLGLLRPRFWCKYVCPTGATFSLVNLLRLTDRKVESSCIDCGQCVKACPFDAIRPDYSTRGADCTFCQTCGGACSAGAIRFVPRWSRVDLKVEDDQGLDEAVRRERRGFMGAAVGTLSAGIGGLAAASLVKAFAARLDGPSPRLPVRPPGSVPEREFLRICTRCGECFQACPNDVLQPAGFQQGLEGLWTPVVAADWSGCEASCNNCGQVCPTGAIRAISLDEKRVARMGLAVVDRQTCLPYAGREECQLCVDECRATGYDAVEFVRVGTRADELGNALEGTGMLAPVVLEDKCVGCGLCQTRCVAVNVAQKGLLRETAILVEAGRGKEDRLLEGSYVQLREEEQRRRRRDRREQLRPDGEAEVYLPDFLN